MSTDIELIIEACKNEQNPKRVKELMRLVKEWDAFIDLAYEHGVFPLVYKALKQHEELISQNVLHSMKMANMDIVKENMLMSAELIKVMKLLEQNGIKAIAFKGPTLAQLAYGDIALRQYSDLDILIKYSELQTAMEVLQNNDYLLDKDEKFKISKQNSIYHDVTFYSSSNISIELHWQLFSNEFKTDFTILPINKNIQTIQISNHTLVSLRPAYLIIYLCIHGAKHNWERLEWLVDISKLIQTQQLDWKYIVDLVEKSKTQKIVFSTLHLVHTYFNTPLEKNIQKYIEEKNIIKLSQQFQSVIESNFYSLGDNVKNLSHAQYKLLNGAKNKSFFIFSLFTPTERDVQTIRLPKKLHSLYYLVRIYNLSRRAFKI